MARGSASRSPASSSSCTAAGSGSRVTSAKAVASTSRFPSHQPNSAVDASAAQAHVLIVEDNDLVAGAMRILFESADHRVSTTASIAETLDLVKADPAKFV